MIPALVIVLALGVSPTSALVLSQVVLSFGIPFALVPLVVLTSRRDVMGVHVNRRLTNVVAFACDRADHRDERVPDRASSCSLVASLADTFTEIVESLPDDWTDLEFDLRIFDERRYVDAAVLLVTCNAQPYSQARLALATDRRPPVRPCRRGARRARRAEAARRGGDRRRDRGARGPHRPRRGRPDVGADGVDPRRSSSGSEPSRTLARAFIPELLRLERVGLARGPRVGSCRPDAARRLTVDHGGRRGGCVVRSSVPSSRSTRTGGGVRDRAPPDSTSCRARGWRARARRRRSVSPAGEPRRS